MKPTRVGPKFQVVIPADVRKQAGLAPGDLVVAEAAPDGAIILRKKILADPPGHETAVGSETVGRRQRGAQPRSGKRLIKRRLDQLSPASMLSRAPRPQKRMPAPEDVSTILKRYSDGKSSTDETLKRLAVDYGTLLSMLSTLNLPWPRLPKAEREQMAKEFAGLWSRAESE